MLAMISAFHQVQAVAGAIGITLFISIGITILSFQTKYDFTVKCILPLILLILALFAFGVLMTIAFFVGPELFSYAQAGYGGLGGVCMAIFLAIDTQMLAGSKRLKYEPEDYVNCAFQIYLDIALMFLYILRGFGSRD